MLLGFNYLVLLGFNYLSIDERHDSVLDDAAVRVPVLPVLRFARDAIPPVAVHWTQRLRV